MYYVFTGGPLKPTDTDNLWVHVNCAWFRPEVTFLSREKMEPATGLLRIPRDSFVKVEKLSWKCMQDVWFDYGCN